MCQKVPIYINLSTKQTHTKCNAILTWTSLRIDSKSLYCRVGLLFHCFPYLGRYTSQLVMYWTLHWSKQHGLSFLVNRKWSSDSGLWVGEFTTRYPNLMKTGDPWLLPPYVEMGTCIFVILMAHTITVRESL